MKGSRIRTALKCSKRRRKKTPTQPFILRWFIVLMLNLSGKSFMFQRLIQMLAGTPPLRNTENHCIKLPDTASRHLCAREGDNRGDKLVWAAARAVH